MKKQRVLSGLRPTGKVQLGNLYGALINWVEMQKDYECFYMIADWHALTTEYTNPSSIKEDIQEMIIDWLAVGIDPNKSTIFLQSDIKQHAELHLLFSMIVPIPWLERCPTYKQQIKEIKNVDLQTYGFLGYPVLQAADILIYNADYVPVGEDQLPHLEIAKDIARRFNHLYKKVFTIPEAKLTNTPRILGIDGRKMSKSYNNCIYLADDKDNIYRKVKNMFTDPKKIKMDDLGHPEGCIVFSFRSIYHQDKIDEIEKNCRAGKIGCVKCKENLAERMISELEPYYKKRNELKKDIKFIENILKEGKEKAEEVAEATMREVRAAVFG